MKTLLLSRAVMPLCFVCAVSVGFAQETELHRENAISRTNISGYGTSLITYQLSSPVICKDTEKLKSFIQEFDGVASVVINEDDIAIQFNEVMNTGQLDLLFERVEMLYLTTSTAKKN